MIDYSVLMSVYAGADPVHLRQALQSMMDQTLRTNDFVLVCDGPLTSELDEVLASFDKAYPGIFNFIRVEKNIGIGPVANLGLSHCRNELIAKMDSDDIAVRERCEKQIARFNECPDIAVLGGHIAEFESDPTKPFSVRVVPCDHKTILRFGRRRQPFNNMTVMYRRSVVLAVGGYKDYRRCEDYNLFMRILHEGYYAENLNEILVYARVNGDAIGRRGSWETLVGCVRSRWESFRIGYSTLLDLGICIIGELVIFISPRGLKRKLYETFLRKKSVPDGGSEINVG